MVLRRAREPLTDREILSRALLIGALKPRGKTPIRSLSAALYLDAKSASATFVRVYKPGPNRAVRGSVRWKLRE